MAARCTPRPYCIAEYPRDLPVAVLRQLRRALVRRLTPVPGLKVLDFLAKPGLLISAHIAPHGELVLNANPLERVLLTFFRHELVRRIELYVRNHPYPWPARKH